MRKIYKILFSRYFISAVVILAEFFLIFYLYATAYGFSRYAFAVVGSVNFFVVISLVNRNSNPEFKLSWLVIVTLASPFGALLYAVFYSRRLSRREARFMREVQDALEGAPSDVGGAECDIEFLELKGLDRLAAGKAFSILSDDRLANLYKNSSSRFFGRGEDMFCSMIRDISAAEKYVFLEYFIIAKGVMWEKIFGLLRQKAAEGVEIRVIYDDIGCMRTLPSGFADTLAEAGIRCASFSPVTPKISSSHNNRDHRKILVIDGRVAYTGGINIADEYINAKERFGHWKDGGVRVSGEAAEGFLRLFLSSWNFTLGALGDIEKYLPTPSAKREEGDGGFYIPFGTGPFPIYSRPGGKNLLLNIINQAKSYVYMTTPYLVIDYDLTEAIRNAARRGVDVRIITPGIADKRTVKVMTKSAYPYLIDAGVRIYEYRPGFIHEKCVVSDDLYALVGTINLDYRSLAHHYEDGVWIYRSPTVISARDEFLNTVSRSDEVGRREAHLTPIEWTVRNFIRIFAPLL